MVTVDRSSPPSTKTRTPWRVVTVPDHTWERSGTTVVSTQIQTGFIVGGADGTLYAVGVEWAQWKGWDYYLKSISMKVRPVQKISRTVLQQNIIIKVRV